MPVGDFAKAVMDGGLQAGLRLSPGRKLPWLSGLGHREEGAQETPSEVLQSLAAIHERLGGSDERLQAKRRNQPKVDLILDDRIIVEVDEFQHFSSKRLLSLETYEQAGITFDLDHYRTLCVKHRGRADAYRRSKTAVDFPGVGGRTSQRAYLDAVRDLLGPPNGWRVIRIPAPEGNLASAIRELVRVARQLDGG